MRALPERGVQVIDGVGGDEHRPRASGHCGRELGILSGGRVLGVQEDLHVASLKPDEHEWLGLWHGRDHGEPEQVAVEAQASLDVRHNEIGRQGLKDRHA